jgi:hypothetical protein
MEIVIALVLLMLALANLVEFLAIRKFGNVSLTMYRDNRAELRMLGESVREIARRRREPRGGSGDRKYRLFVSDDGCTLVRVWSLGGVEIGPVQVCQREHPDDAWSPPTQLIEEVIS